MSIRATLTTRTSEAQKKNSASQIKKTKLSQSIIPSANSLVSLQRNLGNQAFGRFIQPKLKIGEPGDVYEQEADRVADEIMRMPNGQVSGISEGEGNIWRKCAACASGSPYSECEEEGEITIHRKAEHMPDSGGSVPDSFIQNLGPGQPLDNATRNFFEPRFRHDFSHVRVHTDERAAESARAVNALAFTVGRDMVFGAGQYAPGMGEGRRLMAHELTHVVQQATASNRLQTTDFALSSAGSNVLQRKPDKPTLAEQRREQRLEELARDPGEAHFAWKKLNQMERTAVAERMRKRYGSPFAQQFLDVAEKGKPQIETLNFQPGSVPTPEQLIARGFRLGWKVLGNAAVENEFWVHPSGRRIQRDISTWKPGATEPEKSPKTEVKKPPTKEPPVEEPPPMNGKQVKALDLLNQMQKMNDKLQDLLDSDSISWIKVRTNFWKFQDANKELRRLAADPDPDFPDFTFVNDVDPDFSDEFYNAEKDFRDLADKFRELNPGFANGPVEE